MIVASFGVHSMQTQTKLLITRLNSTRSTEATRIGIVTHVDVSIQLNLLVFVG